jgi:precorrin-6A/cobalt-precorrin-6A reductase
LPGSPAERALLTAHRIDVLVTKDSGDADANVAAAPALGVPVLMIDRPPPPPAPVAETVAVAVDWLAYCPEAWPSQPTSRDS